MSVPDTIPQYRLLSDTFFAPKMVLAGSVVATNAAPGPHLMPLNDAAKAAMEAWFDEDHPTLDKDGTVNYEKTYKPHAMYRYAELQNVEVHDVHVLSDPQLNQTGELSLGASLYDKKDTDQRPGPSAVHVQPVPEAVAVKEQSGAAVVEEVKTSADERKAGIKVT